MSGQHAGMPSPDPRVSNPAVVLTLLEDGSSLGSALLPMHASLDLGEGWHITAQHAVLYSGLQYRYDPGVPLVGIGALVLLAGLVISFYFLPARLYVRIEATQGGGCTVGLAATTVKGYDIFETQFRELVAELQTMEMQHEVNPA